MNNEDQKFQSEVMWFGYQQIAGRTDEYFEVDAATIHNQKSKDENTSEGWDA